MLGADSITIYAKSFPTPHYAIGYSIPDDDSDDSSSYQVNTETNGNGSVSAKTNVSAGTKVTVTLTPDDGYTVRSVTVKTVAGDIVSVGKGSDGSYEFIMPASDVTITASYRKLYTDPSVTGVDRLLNTDTHVAYLVGRSDGSFAPDSGMTRAEVAMMFYRLLRNQNVTITKTFPDVEGYRWYAKAVNTLASLGIIKGGVDGNFAPDRTITRAEFTAIVTRFANATSGQASFSDVPSYSWAAKNISTAATYGWINGYPDGTFLPRNTITRAEVAMIVNGMLGRAADEEYVLSNADQMVQFPDMKDSTEWYYLDVVEATTPHSFTELDGTELWNR